MLQHILLLLLSLLDLRKHDFLRAKHILHLRQQSALGKNMESLALLSSVLRLAPRALKLESSEDLIRSTIVKPDSEDVAVAKFAPELGRSVRILTVMAGKADTVRHEFQPKPWKKCRKSCPGPRQCLSRRIRAGIVARLEEQDLERILRHSGLLTICEFYPILETASPTGKGLRNVQGDCR